MAPSHKKQCFTFYTPSTWEFIQPKNDVDFGKLHEASKRHLGDKAGKSLQEMFPEDSRQGINRSANNYHTLNMLYKNPDAAFDDREYADGVLVYKTEESPIPGYYFIEVPSHRKKDAKIVKDQLERKNPPVRDAKSNRIVGGAYQDIVHSLSLDEVADNDDEDDSQLVRDPKPDKSRQPITTKKVVDVVK